jgi:AraC-like DNA-binding protein
LIGPNLPHLYKNDPAYYRPKSKLRAKSIVVHFLEDSFGNGFFSLPETKKIKRLLLKSSRGLDITGKTRKLLVSMLHDLCNLSGLERWMKLLEILKVLSESKDIQYISRANIVGQNEVESERINEVFDFVLKNYHREINVTEVAGIVNLAVNSFSRFFRQRTRKTFIGFLNEVRLSQASKMLVENKLSVTEVCFASGFSNLSNFNKQFKKIYHVNPMLYRKQYWDKMK